MSSSKSREDRKSVILAVLVIISLGLTGKIWFGTPSQAGAYEPFNPRTQQVQDAGLSTLVTPSQILLHLSSDAHLGFLPTTPDYEKLWDKGQLIRSAVAALGGTRRDSVAYSEIQQARTDSIEMVFVDGYRLLDLARIHGASTDTDITVDRIIVTLGRNPAVLVRVYPSLQYVAFSARPEASDLFEPVRQFTAQRPVRYAELQEEIGILHIAPGTFVPRSPEPMALLTVQREPSGVSAVLSTFFIDVSLLRKIEERDGALIYSDGRRGMRIYPSGAMDYGQPEPGGVEIPKMQAVERAALYGLEHGGLPGTAYLDRTIQVKTVTHEGTRVQFNFRYQGVPIIGTRGVIEVFMSSKGAEEFLRNLRAPAGEHGAPVPVMSAREALNAISSKSNEIFGDSNPGYVAAMELAYMNSSPEEQIEPLRPVWSVHTSMGWSLVVDAHNGRVARRAAP